RQSDDRDNPAQQHQQFAQIAHTKSLNHAQYSQFSRIVILSAAIRSGSRIALRSRKIPTSIGPTVQKKI
ncbi:MAG: hypothetical protein WBE44_13075, partial [Terriglobales bacterium]